MRSRELAGTVLLVGGGFVVVAGVIALVGGLWMLMGTRATPDLVVADGQAVSIPEGGFLRGSVPVYADVDVARVAEEPGCELTGRAREGSGMRVDDLFFATGDEVTVDGTTWYPLVEVSLEGGTAQLECPGLPRSATMAVGEPRTFGSWSNFVAPSVVVTGPVFILLGLVGAVLGLLLRRSASAATSGTWQG